MSVLTVRHVTNYQYAQPVELGIHRMMFRPRESHDLKLLRTGLSITPYPASLRWLHDVFDNSIALAQFQGQTAAVTFESSVTLEHYEIPLHQYPLAEYAVTCPFQYLPEDIPNLSQGLAAHFPSENVAQWARQFLDPEGKAQTMDLLRSMNLGIKEKFQYVQRLEEGVQTPDETLQSGRGCCRDFATLMMEALRSLGLASRFVSGYIFIPGTGTTLAGGGATHAWTQVYLPGPGWIDLDPTNAIIGNRDLIRVGLAWSPDQLIPLSGTFEGPTNVCLGMSVTVNVTEEVPEPVIQP